MNSEVVDICNCEEPKAKFYCEICEYNVCEIHKIYHQGDCAKEAERGVC